MKHVVHIAPPLLVIVKVVHTHGLTRFPVSVDQFLKDHRVALLNIHTPLVQPAGAVSGAGDRGADLTCEVSTLIDGNSMTGAAERDGDGHAANSASHYADA